MGRDTLQIDRCAPYFIAHSVKTLETLAFAIYFVLLSTEENSRDVPSIIAAAGHTEGQRRELALRASFGE